MRVVLSTSSGVPMYEQIKNTIRLEVQSGKVEAGQLLPSLRQLATELRVSVITVTRAYNDLVAEKLVANVHGRGFVVLEMDRIVAQYALDGRVHDAVSSLVDAAAAARTPVKVVQVMIEKEWKLHGDGRDRDA